MILVRKAALIALVAALPYAAATAETPKAGAKSPHKAMMMEQFTKMDANKDGSVTQKEIHGYRKGWFGKGDSNGDGALSLAELDAMTATFRAGHLKTRLVMMDTDGDGAVSAEEFARHRGRWMHHLDADGDGAIDSAEIEMAGKHHGRKHGGHRGNKTKHGRHGHR